MLRVAEWGPITQHYVAMTKQKAETSDPMHSRHSPPPASKLTIQCHWEITAPVRFSWLEIITVGMLKRPRVVGLKLTPPYISSLANQTGFYGSILS